jgi:hypothetical protein
LLGLAVRGLLLGKIQELLVQPLLSLQFHQLEGVVAPVKHPVFPV